MTLYTVFVNKRNHVMSHVSEMIHLHVNRNVTILQKILLLTNESFMLL